MDVARLAHLGAVIAARPRIRDAGLLETLDDSERATVHLHLKAARAADEAWEQIVQRHHGPSVVGLTADVERADPTLKRMKMMSKPPMPLLEEDV